MRSKEKTIIILAVVLLLSSAIIGFKSIANVGKLKSSTPLTYTSLQSGTYINNKMKTLAGSLDNITRISLYRTGAPNSKYLTDDYKISVSNSKCDVYMWYTSGTIYYWSACWEPSDNSFSSQSMTASSEHYIYLNADSSQIFRNLKNLTTLNIAPLRFDKVIDAGYIFAGCEKLPTIVKNAQYTLDTGTESIVFEGDNNTISFPSATNLSYLFYDCNALTTINISFTSKVTNMSKMFAGCSSLTTLNFKSISTANVTDMSSLFVGCTKLTSIDLSNFNTAKVSKMFYNCSGLTSLNVSYTAFDTSKVTNMSYMFSGCRGLSTLNLGKFSTNSVTDMSYMFDSCTGLESLYLIRFNTANVTNMHGMFKDCTKLNKIYVSPDGFNTTKVTNSGEMFTNCNNLVGGEGTVFSSAIVSAKRALIDGGTSSPGYFSVLTATIPTCSDKTYNGKEQVLFAANTSGKYTNTELKGTNANTYSVTLTLTEGYRWSDKTTGAKSITCKITPYNLSNATISSVESQKYTGSAITPNVTVKALSKTLTIGTDYSIAYHDNTNAGQATITVTGKGNYTGTKSTNFEIVDSSNPISNLNVVNGNLVKFDYGKKVSDANTQATVTLTIKRGSQTLQASDKLATNDTFTYGGKDYTIVIPGDIHGNGNIDNADFVALYEYFRDRNTNMTDAQKLAADVHPNGNIDISDFVRLFELLKGTN